MSGLPTPSSLATKKTFLFLLIVVNLLAVMSYFYYSTGNLAFFSLPAIIQGTNSELLNSTEATMLTDSLSSSPTLPSISAVQPEQHENITSSSTEIPTTTTTSRPPDTRIRSSRVPSARKNTTRTILVWNSAHRIETAAFGLGGKELFIQQGCEYTDCEVLDTTSGRPLDYFDAIIIQMHELWMAPWPEFNGTRRPDQRLIWLSQESPQTLPVDFGDPRFDHYFNWTMTYRLNADIPLRYGRVWQDISKLGTEKSRIGVPPADRNYAFNKTSPVVWMASHCGTKSLRETYVKELSKFIQVDIYGACGGDKAKQCSRNHAHWLSHAHCYDLLSSTYKFYLSFENSFCTDYVTEKFYHILAHDIVPVVYSGADYSCLAPPHSYINALDYTPEELAAYLTELDRNDTLYNGYFWWKGHYKVEAGVEQMARNGFCDLCRKLHMEDGLAQVYPEMVTEWSWKTQCFELPSWENANTTEMKNLLSKYLNKSSSLSVG